MGTNMIEKRGRKALPKSVRKNKGIYLVTTHKNHKAISAYCKKNNISISGFIRSLISKELGNS